MRMTNGSGDGLVSSVSNLILRGGGPESTNGLSEHSDMLLRSFDQLLSTTRLDAFLRLASTFFLSFAKYLEISSFGTLARGSQVRSYGPAHRTRNYSSPRASFR